MTWSFLVSGWDVHDEINKTPIYAENKIQMVRKKPAGKETAVSISRQVKSVFFCDWKKTGKSINLNTSRNLWSCHLKINQNSSSPRIQALYLCCVSSFNRKEVPEKLPPREMFMGGWLGVFNKFVSASLSLILRHHVFENWKRAEDAWKCSTKIGTISMHKEGSNSGSTQTLYIYILFQQIKQNILHHSKKPSHL